jgi:hypothetical protein
MHRRDLSHLTVQLPHCLHVAVAWVYCATTRPCQSDEPGGDGAAFDCAGYCQERHPCGLCRP